MPFFDSLFIEVIFLQTVGINSEIVGLADSATLEIFILNSSLPDAEVIKPFLPFDLTLLGIGEDGHTASLFPGHQHNESELTHAVYDSPKPPLERVTLSKQTIARSEQVMILVTGSGKKTAVKQWQQGEALPVAQIRAMNGVDVLIEQEAMPD